MLHVLLMGIQYLCAFLIVSLVLLQRGKGADAGAGFGAGASGTVFGARGASTALSRATAILAGVFMITSLSLVYTGTHKAASAGSVLDQLSQQPPASTATTPAAPLVAPEPAGAAGAAAPVAATPAGPPNPPTPAGGTGSSGAPGK
jgi:preprotein translocase subunit SecG